VPSPADEGHQLRLHASRSIASHSAFESSATRIEQLPAMVVLDSLKDRRSIPAATLVQLESSFLIGGDQVDREPTRWPGGGSAP
jgi:hypothetical protein